jgi:hypothetical protein
MIASFSASNQVGEVMKSRNKKKKDTPVIQEISSEEKNPTEEEE